MFEDGINNTDWVEDEMNILLGLNKVEEDIPKSLLQQLEDNKISLREQSNILESINITQNNESLNQHQYLLNKIEELESELESNKQEFKVKETINMKLKDDINSLRAQKDIETNNYELQIQDMRREVEVKQ